MAGGLLPSGRGGRGPRFRPQAEINVTPFVDVMLVLLIVFMVSAPLLTVGVPLDLPKTDAKALPGNSDVLAISIDKDGAIFLQERQIQDLRKGEPGEGEDVQQVDFDELVAILKAVAASRAEGGANPMDERIFIRADLTLQYDTVVKVMARVNAAGFNNIGLVTDPLSK